MRAGAAAAILIGALVLFYGLGCSLNNLLYLYYARPQEGERQLLALLGGLIPLAVALLGGGLVWGAISVLRGRRGVLLPLASTWGVLTAVGLMSGAMALVDYSAYHSEVSPCGSLLWTGLASLVVGLAAAAVGMVLARAGRAPM